MTRTTWATRDEQRETGVLKVTKVLFLDESGDHSLDKIDPQYPVFVLGGIIVDLIYAKGEMDQRVGQFKYSQFGTEDIILHTSDITRNRNGFEELKDPVTRAAFYAGLNGLMESLRYQVLACAIKKEDHLRRYGEAADDPYSLCLHVLVERFCYELKASDEKGFIVAECRNPHLDGLLQAAWQGLASTGTYFVRGGQIGRQIPKLALRPKSSNIAGLQLADLVVSPIARHVLGKPRRPDYDIIERKFRRVPGREGYHGTGLVVLPK